MVRDIWAITTAVLGEIALPQELGATGVTVQRAPPLVVDDLWRGLLGEHYAIRFANATMYLCCDGNEHADTPVGRSRLFQRGRAVYFACWLHGLLAIDHLQILRCTVQSRAGGRDVLKIHTPRLADWKPWYLPWHFDSHADSPMSDLRIIETPDWTADTWRSIDRVSGGILAVQSPEAKARRLWHGFRLLIAALREDGDPHWLERGALMVRSLEPLLFDPEKKAHGGADFFAKMAASFVSGSDASKTLKGLYRDVRNAAVHVHNREKYAARPEFRRAKALIGFAEALAVHVWRQVLSNPELMLAFNDDNIAESQRQLCCGATTRFRFEPFALPILPAVARRN